MIITINATHMTHRRRLVHTKPCMSFLEPCNEMLYEIQESSTEELVL